MAQRLALGVPEAKWLLVRQRWLVLLQSVLAALSLVTTSLEETWLIPSAQVSSMQVRLSVMRRLGLLRMLVIGSSALEKMLVSGWVMPEKTLVILLWASSDPSAHLEQVLSLN